MESKKPTTKQFICRAHPREVIQRLSKDPLNENSLYCIECLLEVEKGVDKTLVTLTKFVESVANHFKGVEEMTEIKAVPTPNLTSFLKDEETTLVKLQVHIEEEKTKADAAINALIQSFTLLCHKKKQEIFRSLDDQYLHLKANFSNYKSKLEKFFPSDASQREKFDEKTLFDKISSCANTEDFEMYVKHLKDEMLDTKISAANPEEQKSQILTNINQFAELIQDQVSNLPTLKGCKGPELEESLKSFEEKQKTFMTDFAAIENPIMELSLTKLALIESKILKDPKDVEMLRKWINPKGIVQLKLIYQASKDGFGAAKFHEKCDSATNTVILVKSNTYGKIFGGFADVDWSASGNYKNSSKTFVFSITEKAKYPIKAGLETYGTYCNASYGPAFGGGHDFMICDNSNTTASSYSNLGHSYNNNDASGGYDTTKLAGAYNFTTEEVEVYQIETSDSKVEESAILKDADYKQVKDWIGKGKKIELNRIYQGTVDGFDATNFHDKCDGKGATLTVVKSQGFEKIFGGYTTVSWGQSGEFSQDGKAFLFSLSKGQKYPIMNGECAVMHSAESGPVFGAGYDLFICSNANILAESTSALGLTFGCDEPDPTIVLAGTPEFMIEEIETFTVKMK